MMRSTLLTALIVGVFLSGIVMMTGCARYQFGAANLYPASIKTVYVPVPRNDTFRHDLNLQLAESLVREIETQTPYKVIGNPSADSILQCRLINENKSVLTETNSDDPRALNLSVAVTASWNDRLGNDLFQNALTRQIDGLDLEAQFDSAIRFVPEAGQSVGTAGLRVADDLAKQIVSQMQVRW